jgi:CubicO group peptidase (beta-lactamase class C family)
MVFVVVTLSEDQRRKPPQLATSTPMCSLRCTSNCISKLHLNRTGDHRPARAWDLAAMAGAGAIRSTAADMLTYLEANLHPDRVKVAADLASGSTRKTP